MDAILIAAAGITVVFVLMLAVKKAAERLARHPICAICVAVSLTWIALLALNMMGVFEDRLLIALLMGQTVVGLYYLAESKVAEQLTFFRLPFLLTLTAGAYMVAAGRHSWQMSGFLAALWILFLSIFAYRDTAARAFVRKAVECCRRW